MSTYPYTVKRVSRWWIVCVEGHELLACESKQDALNAIELALANGEDVRRQFACLSPNTSHR